MNKQTTLNHINKSLSELPVYNSTIPLDDIFQIVKDNGGLVVDESGEEWSGFLCGESGRAVMAVTGIGGKSVGLYVGWYKMESGRYEVTTYVS
jgi:hypothetical protein